MMVRREKQSSAFLPAALAVFLSTGTAFAETQPTAFTSAGTTIVSIGIGLFGLLALYVLFLTASFLLKTFKEWKVSRKEAGHGGEGFSKGSAVLSGFSWLFLLFAILTVGTLFIVLFLLASNIDLSSAKGIGTLIVKIGVSFFVLLALYVLSLPAQTLLGKRGHKKEAHGEETIDSGLPFNPEMTRRSFLSLLGWAWVAFTAAAMGALSTMLRFAFPNVTFEPPLKFMAGFPDTYSQGVDERFKSSHRCWIVRNEKGFYALSTICTHLGCTPNWLQAEQKFKCPCHGSGYYITGVNFEGPAPRPLPRFNIILSDDGQIQVDEAIEYQQELGQWGLPGSFLDYKA